jgi:hypothetical protein
MFQNHLKKFLISQPQKIPLPQAVALSTLHQNDVQSIAIIGSMNPFTLYNDDMHHYHSAIDYTTGS